MLFFRVFVGHRTVVLLREVALKIITPPLEAFACCCLLRHLHAAHDVLKAEPTILS